MSLPSFPQKGQVNSPQVLELPGDAPASIRQWVSQIRFTKEFVRWFGNLQGMTNSGGDDSALVEALPWPAAATDSLEAAAVVAIGAPREASDLPAPAIAAASPSDAPGEPQRPPADVLADLATLLGAPDSATRAAAATALADAVAAQASANTALAEIAALPTFASGTYTPTLSNDVNVTASSAYMCQYMRLGATVVVSGKVNVTPTATLTYAQLGISLPVASNFSAPEQCGGTASSLTTGLAANQGALIGADDVNKRAVMGFDATDTSAEDFFFVFMYQIK